MARRLLAIHSEVERAEIPFEAQELQVGEEVDVKSGYSVKAFPTVHVVPSQGYMVLHRKNKLKSSWLDVAQSEIAEARRRGEEVTDVVESPEVAFTGDTTIAFAALPENSEVLRARVLIMECTFLDDHVDQEGAKERGHMHIKDIADHAHLFQNEVILLMHFSPRFKCDEILAHLDAELPEDLRGRVYPWFQAFMLH